MLNITEEQILLAARRALSQAEAPATTWATACTALDSMLTALGFTVIESGCSVRGPSGQLWNVEQEPERVPEEGPQAADLEVVADSLPELETVSLEGDTPAAVWDPNLQAVRFLAFEPLLLDDTDLPVFQADVHARQAFVGRVLEDWGTDRAGKCRKRLDATMADALRIARWFEELAERMATRLMRGLIGKAEPAAFDRDRLATTVRQLVEQEGAPC